MILYPAKELISVVVCIGKAAAEKQTAKAKANGKTKLLGQLDWRDRQKQQGANRSANLLLTDADDVIRWMEDPYEQEVKCSRNQAHGVVGKYCLNGRSKRDLCYQCDRCYAMDAIPAMLCNPSYAT